VDRLVQDQLANAGFDFDPLTVGFACDATVWQFGKELVARFGKTQEYGQRVGVYVFKGGDSVDGRLGDSRHDGLAW